jgi:hypothetical protein
VAGGEVQNLDGRGRIAQHSQEFIVVPGLEGVERRVANGVVPVVGEEDEDLNLLLYGEGEASLGAFAPDELRGLTLTQSIDQAFRNGLSLREKFSSRRSRSSEST